MSAVVTREFPARIAGFLSAMFLLFSRSSSSLRSRCFCCCHAYRCAPAVRSRSAAGTRNNYYSYYHTSRHLAARRKSRREHTAPVDGALSWEKFEFSESPKWDHRFDGHPDTDLLLLPASGSSRTEDRKARADAVQRLHEQEAAVDAEGATRARHHHAAWTNLDAAAVRRATNLVRPHVTAARVKRLQAVLRQRTGHARFLFENPANPSNVWACLRTIEAFGVQHVDVIMQSDCYRGQAALSQKRGMRTAMGSAQWLTVTHHASTVQAVRAIRAQQPQCYIYAADVNPAAVDIRHTDWTALADRPICLVMGNEEVGISNDLRALADATFTLPMVGFAESFNLSVATAITLAHLSAASSSSSSSSSSVQNGRATASATGPLRPGDLGEHEMNCLLLKGLLNSLPQKRMASAMLRRAGIELPHELSIG